MRRRHLRGVMAIETEVYTRPWSANLFVAEMADVRHRCYLVARDRSAVVGYGGLICYDGDAHVTNVAVATTHQRRGIGARLMHDLLRGGIELGAQQVTLEVRVTNWAAQRLYASYGFRPAGIRRGYYQDVGEDALIMIAEGVGALPFRERLQLRAMELPEDVRP